jgi:hypothetical protein
MQYECAADNKGAFSQPSRWISSSSLLFQNCSQSWRNSSLSAHGPFIYSHNIQYGRLISRLLRERGNIKEKKMQGKEKTPGKEDEEVELE